MDGTEDSCMSFALNQYLNAVFAPTRSKEIIPGCTIVLMKASQASGIAFKDGITETEHK